MAITGGVEIAGLQVAQPLFEFVTQEALPGSGVSARSFWAGLAGLMRDLVPVNARLLQRRDALQARLDDWYRTRCGGGIDVASQRKFLQEIGYLVPQGEPFEVDTRDVDEEIATLAGPQLVVPVDNARYALNAANARWGSLYDALYGTDAVAGTGGAERGAAYNPVRGQRVIGTVRAFLDESFPLVEGSHAQAMGYALDGEGLAVRLTSGRTTRLRSPEACAGFRGDRPAPQLVLLRHHGLHVELQFDRAHPIGAQDRAGISDVVLESALSTIQDCEDSVAAVDAEDKVRVYRHWLGLMEGTLEAEFEKDGRRLQRRLAPDRRYEGMDGTERVLAGRSLMLVRNVGPFLYSDAIRLAGNGVPEALIDAVVTVLAGLRDLRGQGALRNSRRGSIYVVKPKLHGPDEAAFTDQLFERVEQLFGLPRGTVKVGLMDEERRTTVNLTECLRPLRHRLMFINTGFLDRTGDEIHTCMEAGPVLRKDDIKSCTWLAAYERQNVEVGLRCGLPGHAQIGKGMWAMPDQMAAMLESKIAQPRAGASTAWVPSPTAATLHALHYHRVDVAAAQTALATQARSATLEEVLTLPLGSGRWSAAEIEQEIENNLQGILGYVVRWIEHGIGCSKVPDRQGVALMEDRATLRISSQHVANWLRHGICQQAQVEAVLQRMAAVVDEQNRADPAYVPMAPALGTHAAVAAARELVFQGRAQPNGYTERILHRLRASWKRQAREG